MLKLEFGFKINVRIGYCKYSERYIKYWVDHEITFDDYLEYMQTLTANYNDDYENALIDIWKNIDLKPALEKNKDFKYFLEEKYEDMAKEQAQQAQQENEPYDIG